MKITDLHKTYKSGDVHAVNGISLFLPDKGMIFILGKSGCGKSTLLNILSGLDGFDSGDVIFEGKSLKAMSPAELDNYRNHCCGFVFQEYNLIPELNVFDNIALAKELQGKKDVKASVLNALKNVGLEGYERRKVTELSGGQKQRVALARSIVKDPKIIFADEPSGALDEATGKEIFGLLKELSKEKLVIVVSHDRASANTYGDRIIELSDGKVTSDTAAEYKSVEEVPIAPNEKSKRRARLPIKTALKIGCSSFRFHPFRLIATVLLAVFSFTCFGVTFLYLTCDGSKEFADAIYSSGAEYISLNKRTYCDSYKFDYLTQKYIKTRRPERAQFEHSDMEMLQSFFDKELMIVVTELESSISHDYNYIKFTDEEYAEINDKVEHLCFNTSGLVSLTKKQCDSLGYKVVGRLPVAENEIAINECVYNRYKYLFEKLGDPITDPNDLLGKRYLLFMGQLIPTRLSYLKEMAITGVVFTGCDNECNKTNHPLVGTKYDENGKPLDITPENYPEFYQEENSYLFHEKLFVTDEVLISREKDKLYSKWNITHILCPLPKDKGDFIDFAKFISKNSSTLYYVDNDYGDYYLGINDSLESGSSYYVKLALIFLLLTMALLFSYLAASIRSQTKQIGTILSLGADYKSVFIIYLLLALIICVSIALFSIVPTAIAAKFLDLTIKANSATRFRILYMNFPTAILTLAVSVVTAIVTTTIAMLKLRKLSPVTIIGKGQVK